MKKRMVTVSVPATSANLGPGFDSLGLALTLYNDVTFTGYEREGRDELLISVQGVDANKVATNESNLVYQSAMAIFEKAGKRPFSLNINQINRIPVGSGLGSSSTAVLAGMLGANALLGKPFTDAEILAFAVAEEGHPDNVAPALYGGLVLGVMGAGALHIEPFAMPALTAVVVLPTFHLLTTEARAALPSSVPFADAIFNAARTPLLIHALQTANYDKLAIAMQDRLHQPYRQLLIPGMEAAFAAAYDAGARGVAISGAGPSIIAFAPDGHAAIVERVTAVFADAGLSSRHWILPINARGTICGEVVDC
jgi:homoserine kinase